MASHQETDYAKYIPLESRGNSATRFNSKYMADESTTRFDPKHPGEASSVHGLSTGIQPKVLDHPRQIWSLLLPQTARWLGTVVLSILLVLVLRIYSSKGNFTSNDKDVFNVIVTGLSVGLGINFFVGLTIATEPAASHTYRAIGSFQRVCQRFTMADTC